MSALRLAESALNKKIKKKINALLKYRGGSTLVQGGEAGAPPDSLVAPDSKASWKNAGLYGVRIYRFRTTDKIDSVMKRLMEQCSKNLWQNKMK